MGFDFFCLFVFSEGRLLDKYARGGLAAICSDLKAQSALFIKKEKPVSLVMCLKLHHKATQLQIKGRISLQCINILFYIHIYDFSNFALYVIMTCCDQEVEMWVKS